MKPQSLLSQIIEFRQKKKKNTKTDQSPENVSSSKKTENDSKETHNKSKKTENDIKETQNKSKKTENDSKDTQNRSKETAKAKTKWPET